MNIFKRLGVAIDFFRNVDSGKLFQSLLGERNISFLGGFTFTDGSQKLFLREGYAKNSDVYSINRKIAQTAALIPWKLYDVKAKGERELVTEGELFQLLKCPNRLQTKVEYTELAITYLNVTGNSYTAGSKAEGMGEVIREFTNLPSDETEIILGNVIDPIFGYQVNGVRTVRFEKDEVMHVKYSNPAGQDEERLVGMSPLQAGNRVLQTGNNQQEASASILKNKGASGILTSDGERSFNKEQGEELQSAWDKKASGATRYGKILATSAQLRYLQIGMSPTDLRLIENQVITLRQLCNIYSVDSSLFNDPANKTFNNRKEATKALYTESVLPTLGLLIEGLNIWLLPAWSARDNKNYLLEPDVQSINALREDINELSKRVSQQRKDGIISGNEARDILGYDSSEVDGMDDIIISSGTKPIDQDENSTE